MTKQKYNYESFVKRGFSIIGRALKDKKSLYETSENIKGLVNSYLGLTKRERLRLYNSLYYLCRASKRNKNWQKKISLRSNYDYVVTTSRKVKASSELRNKRAAVYVAMQVKKTVFFLCSSHYNPAKDHKDYQGKIYVDRFWRQKVTGDEYVAVLSYIRNHNIRTVQEIMGPPVYLTTRPYCKHFFIELDTDTVLHSSLKKIVKQHGITVDPVYSAKDYYDLRSTVFEKLNKISPCMEFELKMKSRA